MNDGAPSSRRSSVRWGAIGVGAIGTIALVYLAASELRTSAWQARWLARVASDMRFELAPGPSASIRFPVEGPFDERLGYTRIPAFVERALTRDNEVVAQARQTPEMADFIERGYFAPYREKTQAGLRVLDCRGGDLYSTRHPQHAYAGFEAVPPLVARTLTFIENRDLLADIEPTRNPALELPRLGRAVLDQAIKLVDPHHPGAGGSTLATQIEKYRHSPDGRTAAIMDKWLQVASASVRAYIEGQDTRAARERILLDYVNTVPLGALRGWGEVNGIGDGLVAWYGADFDTAGRALRDNPTTPQALRMQARVYRQALSLMIAQRRPAFFFGPGQGELAKLTDRYLRRLSHEGVISPQLRDAALDAWTPVREQHAEPPRGMGPDAKAAASTRVQIASLLDVNTAYELDRLDLAAASTLDARLQSSVTALLHRLRDPRAARDAGLIGDKLLDSGDPSKLIYSFTLVERGDDGLNRVRVQTDNVDRPFDINTGAKLELGSTAKLRTLATYLETIATLHAELSPLNPEERERLASQRRDRLTRWAADHLAQATDPGLEAMLKAAMERRYSAHPGETFFTGGGEHRFENFDRDSDSRRPTLYEGFRDSVNLVFIRLMRDIVQHEIARAPGMAGVLENDLHPARAQLLARFADREGSQFLRGFYRLYQGKTPAEVGALLSSRVKPGASRLAAVHRLLWPNADFDTFAAFINERTALKPPAPSQLRAMYKTHGSLSLSDLGYVAGIHPLELWLAAHLRAHPEASLQQVLDASKAQRQEVYGWLVRKKDKRARDVRIRQLLEVDAFAEIHKRWQRVGFPFDTLVPSYATAIGSSGDRPAALADLMGIIVNNGLRLPTVQIEGLHLAAGTPYETVLRRRASQGERVMAPEVAHELKRALALVVEQGTARRLRNAFNTPGTALAIGGKTGTGDNRFNRYTKGGGLIDSRVVSRTATFVFYLGERHFGTMTAYVPGPEAQGYRFTSGLPVQIVKTMAPLLAPLARDGNASCGMPADDQRPQPSTAWPTPQMPPLVAHTLRGLPMPLDGPTLGSAVLAPRP